MDVKHENARGLERSCGRIRWGTHRGLIGQLPAPSRKTSTRARLEHALACDPVTTGERLAVGPAAAPVAARGEREGWTVSSNPRYSQRESRIR